MQCTPSALKGYSYDCYFVKRKMLREVLMDIHAKTGSAGSIDPLLPLPHTPVCVGTSTLSHRLKEETRLVV